MQFKWKRFWNSHKDADLERNRATLAKKQSLSFMSAIYDRAVRTNSYNEIVMKIDVLAGQSRADNARAGLPSLAHTDTLLEPSQEAIDALLQEQTGSESPELMKMAIDFFENSRIACMLCGAILQNIDQLKGQCGHMEATLAQMPLSGEALGFTQQRLMAQCLAEMVDAENPFADGEVHEMFTNVKNRYSLLSSELEVRRIVVGRKVKVLKRWRGGCIGVAVAMVAGVTLVAVVVTTHMVVRVAAAPMVVAAAVVAMGKLQKKTEGGSEGSVGGQGAEMHGDGARMQGNGVAMVEVGSVRGRSHADVVAKGGGECIEEVTLWDADGGAARMDGNVSGGSEFRGEGMVEINRFCGGATGADGIVADLGGRAVGRGGRRREECWCWGIAMFAGQSVKLDALAHGSFLVNRMLDTLRCLVTGVQDDVTRNCKLVELGWMHREEAVFVHQVGKQLFRSHMHLVRQLANLEEQVAVCLLLINKARTYVLQEFSPKAS